MIEYLLALVAWGMAGYYSATSMAGLTLVLTLALSANYVIGPHKE